MKKALIALSIVASLAAALVGAGAWYLFGDDAAGADAERDVTRSVLVAAARGATLGPWYLHKAAGMPAEQLLAEIIAMKGGTAVQRDEKPVAEPALKALASRAGHALPAELAAILRTPGATAALKWSAPAEIATLRELHGDKLPGKFRMEARQWQGGTVPVESNGGAVHRVSSGALERYLVLAEDGLLGDAMLLYDPAEPPAHPCCRVIETSPFKSQNHDAYRSLADYLRWEWAMAKAR